GRLAAPLKGTDEPHQKSPAVDREELLLRVLRDEDRFGIDDRADPVPVTLDTQLDRRGQGDAQRRGDALTPVEREDRGRRQVVSPFPLDRKARGADRSRDGSAVEQGGLSLTGVLKSNPGQRRDAEKRRRLLLDSGLLNPLAHRRLVRGL